MPGGTYLEADPLYHDTVLDQLKWKVSGLAFFVDSLSL